MQVRFEMTKRMAEMAGFADHTLDVGAENTLEDALRSLAERFRSAGAAALLRDGDLHPSILVVVDGEARSVQDRNLALHGGETIDLLLPIAGG